MKSLCVTVWLKVLTCRSVVVSDRIEWPKQAVQASRIIRLILNALVIERLNGALFQ